MKKFFDVIIIGAGASGMFCAISALARGKTVAVLDHNSTVLNKVRISGGGKCNFTNTNTSVKNYFTSSDKENIIEKTLSKFTSNDFLSLIKKHNVKFIKKETGQLFGDSALDIIDILKNETKKANLFTKTNILNISKNNDCYNIETSIGEMEAKSLVVATGGVSYPNIGASEIGYKIAKDFGLKIIPYKPALVPFNLDNEIMKELIKLQGVSINVKIKLNQKEFNGDMIFTHFGISGPVVLQTSLYWNKGEKITINLLPDFDIKKELKILRETSKGKKISNILSKHLPQKIADFITAESDCFITEISNKNIDRISNNVNNWEVTPIGTQSYKMAEVTSGGVSLEDIKENFESKKNPNLFFIGEVLDVTGQLGGYNLQWAWSSGFVAGKNV